MAFSPYNLDEQLSDHFTLGDLMKTNQSTPNFPDADSYTNLHALAAVLEQLFTQIGPFDVASAYRSPETNAAVGGSPTSAHLHGQAADIIPTTMSIEDYFIRIYDSPFREQLGEITFKETQGALHLTLPLLSPPYQTEKIGVAEILDHGTYRYMTDAEIEEIRNPSAATPDTTVSDLVTEETSYSAPSFTPKTALAVVALALAVSYFIYSKRKLAS